MSAVTIRDVAKRAKVGIGTVSRVLNNHPSVHMETRQRVLEAIEELDYAPNPIARQLSLGRTNTISVTLPFLTFPSFVERLRGVQSALAESGHQLILYSVQTAEHRDRHLEQLMRQVRPDGILILSIPLFDDHVHRLKERGIPTVLVDVDIPHAHRVYTDDFQGGYLATQHLLDLGHTRIACLSDILDTELSFVTTRLRYQGYCQALEDCGITPRPAYHIEDHHGRAEARAMAHTVLALDEPPTAIFACSDTQAIGVLDAAADLGLSIPDELSVMGYDNIRDAEYLNISTINQPLFESGFEGAQLLLSLIAHPDDDIHDIALDLTLIQRGTTAPLRASANNRTI